MKIWDIIVIISFRVFHRNCKIFNCSSLTLILMEVCSLSGFPLPGWWLHCVQLQIIMVKCISSWPTLSCCDVNSMWYFSSVCFWMAWLFCDPLGTWIIHLENCEWENISFASLYGLRVVRFEFYWVMHDIPANNPFLFTLYFYFYLVVW